MRSPWWWRWLVVVGLVLAVAWPGLAEAKKARKKAGAKAKKARIVVLDLGGDDGGAAKKAVVKALKKKATVVEAAGSDIAAARVAGVTVVVAGDVGAGKKKGSVVVNLSVHEGATGDLVATSTLRAPTKAKLGKTADKQLWKDIGKGVGKARPAGDDDAAVAAAPEPAAPPPPEPAAPPAADDEPAAGAPASTASAAPASASASVSASVTTGRARRSKLPAVTLYGRPFLRGLSYNDDLDARLRRYDLTAASVGIGVEWFGLTPYLGLAAGYEQAVGLDGSATGDGMSFETRASSLHAGVRARVRLGGVRSTVELDGGQQRLSIDDGAMALVPSVTYTYARAGLALDAPLAARLRLDAGGGYRHLFGTGELGSAAWFPRLTGAGADAHVGLAYRLGGGLAATARAELVRWFFSMNPEPGDPWIAGGAVDQYLSVAVGLSWTP